MKRLVTKESLKRISTRTGNLNSDPILTPEAFRKYCTTEGNMPSINFGYSTQAEHEAEEVLLKERY